MKKTQKNKRIGMTIGAVLLLVIVIIIGLMSCGKESGSDKELKETGEEIRIEEKKSEDGLDVSDPEDADSENSEGTVEFIGPDETVSDKETVTESDNTVSGSDNKEVGEGTDAEVENNENTDEKDSAGNLDETDDNSNGGYGDFF